MASEHSEELLQCKGKSSWPELVNKLGTIAKATVEEENPNVKAQIVSEGSPVTGDFRCNRVRVVVNTRGFVTRVPTIG